MAPKAIEETIVVEMSDTDMSRFIHFASVVEYFEVGLRRIMEEADLSFRELFDRRIGLPIVNVSCEYRNPMFYRDELKLRTHVSEISEKTMTLSCILEKGERTTAQGTLTFSFYDIDNQCGIPIPDDVLEDLREAELIE